MSTICQRHNGTPKSGKDEDKVVVLGTETFVAPHEREPQFCSHHTFRSHNDLHVIDRNNNTAASSLLWYLGRSSGSDPAFDGHTTWGTTIAVNKTQSCLY